ncbi:MAG: hypothetical protein ACYCX3_12115 [Thermoleophilia bacterium]
MLDASSRRPGSAQARNAAVGDEAAGSAGGDRRPLRMVRDCEAPAVSEKIVRIILSYTSVLQSSSWRLASRHVEA